MNSSLQQLRGVRGSYTRPGGGTAAGSVMRITLLTLLTLTAIAHISVSAQEELGTLTLKNVFVNEQYEFSFKETVKGAGEGAKWYVIRESKRDLSETELLDIIGLSLSEEGKLSGIPKVTAAQKRPYEFTVQATSAGKQTFITKVVLQVLSANFDPSKINQDIAEFAPPTPKSPPPCQPPTSTFILASSTADEETIALTEDVDFDPAGIYNPNTLEILNADRLIEETLGNTPMGEVPPVFKEGDYTVIHMIKWKAVKAETDKTDPDKELWALYELVDGGAGAGLGWVARMNPDDKQNFDTRIFGSRRVAVLLLHLQTPRTWDVKYKVNINRRVPQPIQNVLQLAAFVGGAGVAGEDCVPSLTRNIWGGRMMHVRHMASDMIVKLNTVTANSNGSQISQSKEHSKSYLNEGRYHWDVSVGMPVKSIKELEFSSENGIVTAKKKERQNAYGFLNLFPRAVDLNGKSFLTSPHFVLGVPISGKPLDRPLIGVGTGIYREQFKINFFAGVAFNKVREPRTLVAGQTATAGQLESDLETRRVRKFVFGINFPVKQFIDAVKGAK